MADEAAAEYSHIFEYEHDLDERAKLDGVLPLAYYSAALLSVKNGDYDEASFAHAKAAKCSGYTLQKLFTFRLYSLKQSIDAKLA